MSCVISHTEAPPLLISPKSSDFSTSRSPHIPSADLFWEHPRGGGGGCLLGLPEPGSFYETGKALAY